MAIMNQNTINGQVYIDCSRCGEMFAAWGPDDDTDIMRMYYGADDRRHCPRCIQELERLAHAQELRLQLPKMAAEAGIPELYRIDRETGMPMTAPTVPRVAEFFEQNRWRNLLVSGPTGVGKSTSACWEAMKLIAEGKRVQYVKLRKLLADWRDVRTSSTSYACGRFFQEIGKLDLLILDEVADKVKMTESGQELMFELLDMIADGEIRTRMWILGNFRAGVLRELFGDADPVYRRIQENFVCVGIDRHTIERIEVWRAQ